MAFPLCSELAYVDIPAEFIEMAKDWHCGQDDLLYAVASSGGLYLGTLRPYDSDAKRALTDHEWHLHLWLGLSCDVRHALKGALGHDMYEADGLANFERFCDETAARLRIAYGLEESDVV